MTKKIVVFVLGLAGLALTTPRGASAAVAVADLYHVQGTVMEIKNQGRVLLIQHEAVPGLMGAMTMPFELADPRLAKGIKVGDKIRFTIVHKGGFWPIVALKKVRKMKTPIPKSAAAGLGTAKPAVAPAPTTAPMNMPM